MAWEWSHTAEAYEKAYENLQEIPVDDLRVIWAEWESFRGDEAEGEDEGEDGEGFDSEAYEEALDTAENLPADVLAEDIWRRMEELRTCENGGEYLWACPYGCGCHLVSVDREIEE